MAVAPQALVPKTPFWIIFSTLTKVSSDQNAGDLLYAGDEILSGYIGIITSYYKDPY